MSECPHGVPRTELCSKCDVPTPRDTPIVYGSVRPVNVEVEIATCYRELLDACDRYEQLNDEQRDKVSSFIPRARLVTLLEVVERYLRNVN